MHSLPALLLLAACSSTPAEEPPAPPPTQVPTDFSGLVAHFVDDPAQRAALAAQLEADAGALAEDLSAHGPADPAQVRAVFEELVTARLSSWATHGLPVDATRLRRQALDWERFRLARYVSSGVFPKTYFGFFDEAGDTAAAEVVLRETTGCACGEINAWLVEGGNPLRVTDAEIAVTFVAEGGALLLTIDQARMDQLHPVLDVGLDNIASGLGDYGALLHRLDRACGTDLAGTVAHTAPGQQPAGAIGRLMAPQGQDAWLMRPATFREGIVGTALMWIWEKEIAQRELATEGRDPLWERSLAEQYVIGSLVYNSGILHSEATTRSLLAFDTGARLFQDSEKNAHRRPRLNLLAPGPLLEELLRSGTLREQHTSWLGVYHVLQRYGAWEGLRRFSAVFDEDGRFTARTDPAPAPRPR
ncbi:MAG: hypothetical protein ABIO70_22625 [Pseudomonadota bacterium]